MNIHQSPRVDSVRDYLKMLQQRDTQRDREQFVDKGRDTLLDGYTDDQLETVCRQLWTQGGSSPECHFRTLVDILLGHYMLTRGGDRRAAELSDLFTFEFQGEGSTRCMPLILTTRASKQNQHGRLETMGALRHKIPLVCVLSALAFYLFYRWDLTDEPFPDFTSRPSWYGIRLIKRATGSGDDRTQPLSYTSQREWAAKAFRQVGIHTTTITHVGRAAGAKAAELKGVSEDQIRRAGRWNHEQMVGCYLNVLPREFMRIMAGHPSQLGCFEINRASVTPPDVLLSLIWPELDAWKNRFGPQSDQINDLAASGITSLLFYLREVILQDSVVLRQRFPDNAVWTHPVFQHPAYDNFARQITAAAGLNEGESLSRSVLLYQALPQLVDHLTAMEARNIQRDASNKRHQAEIKTLIDSVTEHQAVQAAQAAQLQLLISNGLTFRLELPTATAAMATAIATSPATSTPTPTPASTSTPMPILQETHHPIIQAPTYCMSRSVKTVERLWQEWTVGLQGGPAIRTLDSTWGSRWRAGKRSELQWYSLRLEAMKEIKRIAQSQRTSEEAAMWQLHVEQQRTGYSLDRLCKQLRTSRKSQITRHRVV
jgi:Centromere DNA-binding protein complex CBF3 subunit, domain 2/Transcriptional activator of glycolytic enzymes